MTDSQHDDQNEEDSAHDDSSDLTAHALTRERLSKYRAHMSDGGFPYSFQRTHTARDIRLSHADLAPGSETGDVVTVAGRLMNTRAMGKLAFGVLSDLSGTIQLFVDRRTLGDEAFDSFLDLDSGDWIGATGEVITSKRGELSVRISEYSLLQKSLRPLPDKWHGLKDVEARSRQRYLDLIANPDSRTTALVRSKIVSELRSQFEARGFVEVDTPVLLSEATGATARPFDTHHNALDMDMQLRIATELYLKRLVVGGLEKVFEIGRIFRNEGVDSNHNPEFTMLESYEAFADYTDVMAMVEEIMSACAVVATGASDIEYQGKALDLAGPYRRVSMLELVQDATNSEIGYDTDIETLRDLARTHGVEPEDHWGSGKVDRKSTRLNSSHTDISRMPSSA